MASIREPALFDGNDRLSTMSSKGRRTAGNEETAYLDWISDMAAVADVDETADEIPAGSAMRGESSGKPDGRHRAQRGGQLRNWLIFIGVAAARGALVWAGPALLNRHALFGGDTVQSNSAVTVGLTNVPKTLDIRTNDDAGLNRALIGNVYETLLDRDGRNQPTAGLARTWSTSKDGLRLTFTLRSGLRFSNGHVLDASDVVWSLQQAIQHKWPGAETAFAALTSVTNTDETTVTITLSKPDASLTRTLSDRLGIVYDSEADIDYRNAAVGSGAFSVKTFTPGSVLTLVARDDADAKTGTVTLRNFADDAALLKAARTGDVDLAVPDDPAAAAELKNEPSVKVSEGVSEGKVTLLYNNDNSSILSDLQVRQALRVILDKNALVDGRQDVAQSSDGKPMLLGGPIGPLEPGYEDLTGLFPHDVAKGRRMLSYFYANYLGTFKLIAPHSYRSLAQAITDQLTDAGLSVHMETLDDDELAQRKESRDFNLLITVLDGTASTASYADPNSLTRYNSADAQEQYASALASTTEVAYRNALNTYARTVSNDAASDWLYARKVSVVASTKLKGYPVQMADERLSLKGITKQ